MRYKSISSHIYKKNRVTFMSRMKKNSFAVFNSNEKISGVTVHYVDEEYDKGPVLLQKKIDITDCSNPKQIAEKVLKLEHEIFPKAIIKHLKSINKYEKN